MVQNMKSSKAAKDKAAPKSKKNTKNKIQDNASSKPEETQTIISTVKSTENGEQLVFNGDVKTIKTDKIDLVSVTEKGEECATLPKSKTKGQTKKAVTMETTEETATESKAVIVPDINVVPLTDPVNTSEQNVAEDMEVDLVNEATEPSTSSTRSQKRKAESESLEPKKGAKETKVDRIVKHKAKLPKAGKTEPVTGSTAAVADLNEADGNMEVDSDGETTAKVTHPSASSTISLKRRFESKPQTKTDAKGTKVVKVVKPKSKRQKVDLGIPPMKSISGKVFVVGDNNVGQLGLGEDVEVKKRPAMLELPQSIVDIAAGGMHSVILTESGEVITFGCNDEGALGRLITDESSESTPHRVEITERITKISAGDSHTAALSESGNVYLWGNFRSLCGEIGLTADGVKQVKPIRILNDITIVNISSGNDHLVCLSNEGNVYTLGCGENGQLGRVAKRNSDDGGRKGKAVLLTPTIVPLHHAYIPIPVEDIFAGAHTTFLKAKDTGWIYAFGLNNYNHLGFENSSPTELSMYFPKQVTSFNDRVWLQITSGQHHTLALDSNGLVYSLGCKEYGRLGLGENCEEMSIPTVIPTLQNTSCTQISCGNWESFSLSKDGLVWSWGFGENHQLGHGNDEDCFVPRCIEGSFVTNWKALKVSGGGQHTLILATPKESAPTQKK